MHDATLCYLVDETRVLLALKKKGFGKGRWNGCGGKVNPGESLEAAAARELYEEARVVIAQADLEKVAELDFFFPHVAEEKDWDQRVHVYITKAWKGEPQETAEMQPNWFLKGPLLQEHNPEYGSMWPDDRYWLPLVLEKKKVKGTFIFSQDGNVLRKRIDVVSWFESEEERP